jgi:protease PrsW
MEVLLLLLLAIIPGLYYAYRYYSQDIYKKEPWEVLSKTFLWGCASIIPAAIIEMQLPEGDKNDLASSLISNFIYIGLVEELAKFFVLRFYTWRNEHFDEVMDGIVYGAMAGSGFATFENVFYVMENGFGIGVIRALISVPSHILEGAIIGYWLARYKFADGTIFEFLVKGLGFAVVAHGFFDFVLTYQESQYFYLCLVPVILMVYFVKKWIREGLEYDRIYIHKLGPSPIEVPITINSHPEGSIYVRFISIVLALIGSILILVGVLFFAAFLSLILENDPQADPYAFILVAMLICPGVYLIWKGKILSEGSRTN